MAQTTISDRMDDDLKKNFDMKCNELGISISLSCSDAGKEDGPRKKTAF